MAELSSDLFVDVNVDHVGLPADAHLVELGRAASVRVSLWAKYGDVVSWDQELATSIGGCRNSRVVIRDGPTANTPTWRNTHAQAYCLGSRCWLHARTALS